MAAPGSIVREQQPQQAADALNPEAREFLPWWRLIESSSRKQLSPDAPEFVTTPFGKAAAAAANRGVLIARPKNKAAGTAGRAAEDNAQAPDALQAPGTKQEVAQDEDST